MAWPIIDTALPRKEDGYNDILRTIIGGLLSAAAIASAMYNINRAVSIAEDEWNLAKKYWRIGENWLQYYKDSYAPVEDQELKEARTGTTEKPKYDVARGRMRAAAWNGFKGAYDKAVRCTSRYCTGKRKEVLETVAFAQANALALCDSLGYRNERAYIEARDDERFKRLIETAKRGRNMASDPISFAASSSGIYGAAADQAWQGIVGAGQFLGYMTNRAQTYYPQTVLATGALQQPQQVSPAVAHVSQAVSSIGMEPGEQLLRQVGP